MKSVLKPERSTKVFKIVRMPRQHILKKLGPEGSKTVEEVDAALRPLINEYIAIVVNNRHGAFARSLGIISSAGTVHNLGYCAIAVPVSTFLWRLHL